MLGYGYGIVRFIGVEDASLCQILNPLKGDELVSVLHRTSVQHRACTALISTHDTSESEDSGASDNGPVLAQHAEQEAFLIDRERFTQARRSCLEPDRSVGKEPVGEPSLSSEEECLSLHDSILSHEEKSGNGDPTTQAPDNDSAFLPSRKRRREQCLGFGENQACTYLRCFSIAYRHHSAGPGSVDEGLDRN